MDEPVEEVFGNEQVHPFDDRNQPRHVVMMRRQRRLTGWMSLIQRHCRSGCPTLFVRQMINALYQETVDQRRSVSVACSVNGNVWAGPGGINHAVMSPAP